MRRYPSKHRVALIERGGKGFHGKHGRARKKAERREARERLRREHDIAASDFE